MEFSTTLAVVKAMSKVPAIIPDKTYVAIICGSRDISLDQPWINRINKLVKDNNIYIEEVVSGGVRGGARIGEGWAVDNDADLTIMRANWRRYGKSAVVKRNIRMLNYVLNHPSVHEPTPIVIAIWDGQSKGTKHTILKARAAGIRVEILERESKNEG